MEHWTPPHIVHSTGPFANPYHIDPICLSGMDYSAVLVMVKAWSLSDIPHALAMYGFDGLGTIADISIIRSEPLPGFPLPGGLGANGDREGWRAWS
jgi:hypothetical protein